MVGRLPVDYAGFVFASSRRSVSPELAGELIRMMRASSSSAGREQMAAGVFVNPGLDRLELTLREAPLDILQLHGSESPEECREAAGLGLTVWKALHGSPGETREEIAARLEAYAAAGVDTFLLDTAGGGTGKVFDWSILPAYLEAAHLLGKRLYAAGGLHAGNVGQLIAQYRPDGVDVSSGVEREGKKDLELIRAFTERVKQR